MKFNTFHISNILILNLVSKIIFIKFLPPVWPKVVSKLTRLRIYWNLTFPIFQICQSRFWCQKWFLSNIYHLLDLNCFQNYKCPEFIEIWHIWYFKYVDLNFNVKNDFLSNMCQLLSPNWCQNEKCSEFIEIWLNLYFKYDDLNLDAENDFYYIFTTC